MRVLLALWLVGAPLVSANLKIACLGGSSTKPWENDKFYPEFLADELGGDAQVTNNGVPMATVMDVSCKAKPIRGQQVWQDAKNSNPNVVTLNLGMNDSRECNWGHTGAGEYKSKYGEIIQAIKGWPSSPTVYILNSQPLYPPYPNQHEFDPKIANDVLPGLHKEIADANGVGMIDTFNLLGGTGKSKQDLVLEDGGHANKAGHKAIAKMIADRLKSDGKAAAAAAAVSGAPETPVGLKLEENTESQQPAPEPTQEAPKEVMPVDAPKPETSAEAPAADPVIQVPAAETPSEASVSQQPEELVKAALQPGL
jgi:lysophospholipase L1-like esterase